MHSGAEVEGSEEAETSDWKKRLPDGIRNGEKV